MGENSKEFKAGYQHAIDILSQGVRDGAVQAYAVSLLELRRGDEPTTEEPTTEEPVAEEASVAA